MVGGVLVRFLYCRVSEGVCLRRFGGGLDGNSRASILRRRKSNLCISGIDATCGLEGRAVYRDMVTSSEEEEVTWASAGASGRHLCEHSKMYLNAEVRS